MVNSIKGGGEIQKDKACDRPFGYIEKNIIVNIKGALSVEWGFL